MFTDIPVLDEALEMHGDLHVYPHPLDFKICRAIAIPLNCLKHSSNVFFSTRRCVQQTS